MHAHKCERVKLRAEVLLKKYPKPKLFNTNVDITYGNNNNAQFSDKTNKTK